jgi:hypothetical protein
MDFGVFKAKTKDRNILAKSDVLGSFDFFTTIVSLESIVSGDLHAYPAASLLELAEQGAKLPEQEYQRAAKILPLALHEYAHFFDATSTLWGMKHLQLMNRAYLSDDRRQSDETNFCRAKQFLDHVRRIHLPRYYTVVTPSPAVRPWRTDLSIGQLFDSAGNLSGRRIVFQRFQNANGDLLVRSPISQLSLLESSAMAQQILVHAFLVDRLDGDYGLVERRDFASRTLDYLYNKELTEYSVCVHVVANKLGCNDGVASFAASALIVRIVLNLPVAAFDNLSKANDLMERIGLPTDAAHAEFEKALRDGLSHVDLGTMFYLIARCLPREAGLLPSRAASVVHAATERLGLDNARLQNMALEEARSIGEELAQSSIAFLAMLGPLALHNMASIRFDRPRLDFSSLHLPRALLGDSTQVRLFGDVKSPLSEVDLDSVFSELYEGQRWVERFTEACV